MKGQAWEQSHISIVWVESEVKGERALEEPGSQESGCSAATSGPHGHV